LRGIEGRSLFKRFSKDLGGHFVEEFLLVFEVPIEGWSLNAEPGRKPPQRQSFQAHLIEDGEGLAENDLAIEGHKKV
jgi:hypothetical protein